MGLFGNPSRRGLAALFVAAAAGATILPAGIASAQEVIKAVTAFPKTLAFSKSFAGFADLVNERGKGVVRIDYMGGPEIIPQNQQMDAVRRGIVDMHYGPASFHLGNMPEADAWVGATVNAMDARKNGGFEVMKRAFKDKLGVELLAHIDSGVQFYVYLIKEPKRTADGGVDLNGLKIRSQPIYRSFFESMGAVPVNVPAADVYTGLERSTFDGAGWPIIGIKDLSWDKFLRYRIDPGFYETDLGIYMNPAKWASLSDKAKEILTQAAVDYEKISYENFQKEIADTDKKVRDEGMTVIKLEGPAAKKYLDLAYESAWKRMKDAGSSYYDELRSKYYNR
jgi:TRAP-type C4-dicarboxylate transport system substrate-binding protein